MYRQLFMEYYYFNNYTIDMLLSTLSLYFCMFGNPKLIINFLVAKLNNIKCYSIYSSYFIYTTKKNIYLNLSIEDTNI